MKRTRAHAWDMISHARITRFNIFKKFNFRFALKSDYLFLTSLLNGANQISQLIKSIIYHLSNPQKDALGFDKNTKIGLDIYNHML